LGSPPGLKLSFKGHGRPGKKEVFFSDFGLNTLVYREFPKAGSGKSFVSSPIAKDILFLLGRE
jgi:hypothetical protein